MVTGVGATITTLGVVETVKVLVTSIVDCDRGVVGCAAVVEGLDATLMVNGRLPKLPSPSN